MSTKIAIVIGRFQPFHQLHANLIQEAANQADRVLVLVGGSNRPRTPKDPFTVEERREMITRWASRECRSVFCVAAIEDFPYSDTMWAADVQATVNLLTPPDAEIILVGCNKDSSTFYLNMFPQWKLHEVPHVKMVDATKIRDLYFDGHDIKFIDGVVPPTTMQFLSDFKSNPVYQWIVNEKRTIDLYKKKWEVAPYAPTFVTVDACVIQSGHVLLVKRKHAPGRGLFALPGGFLDHNERIVDGVIRELREETRLKVPGPVLKGSIKETHVFDNPTRSLRGRTITHAALIVLQDGPLPKVKGSDDAEWAGWVELSECKGDQFFEDHFDMINYFKSRV